MSEKLEIQLPSLKGAKDVGDFENIFYPCLKHICYFNDTDKIIDYIKESFENHKKVKFWLCVEFALNCNAYIEDYFYSINKAVPKEIVKASDYFGRLKNLDLVPSKKENIKKNVWVIIDYFKNNKTEIKKTLKIA